MRFDISHQWIDGFQPNLEQSQIVEVIVTSVGCLVQDMTLFIILPSSNECKTLAPFTVVSAYL